MVVRQDLTTFTIILEVRKVSRRSLCLDWSEIGCHGDPNSMHFMLSGTSRGDGGCSLPWGIVFLCPVPSNFAVDNSEGAPQRPEITPCEEPLVLACQVSPSNVAIIIRKPASLRTWWDSIAVGRVIDGGLQVCYKS